MKAFLLIILVVGCATTSPQYKSDVDLSEVINRVDKDQTLDENKKLYLKSELVHAQTSLNNKTQYIIELEENSKTQQKQINDLNQKIEKLSVAQGRVNQIDYQFWGMIGIALLILIFIVLYIILKFGNAVGKFANPQALAVDAAKRAAGL